MFVQISVDKSDKLHDGTRMPICGSIRISIGVYVCLTRMFVQISVDKSDNLHDGTGMSVCGSIRI